MKPEPMAPVRPVTKHKIAFLIHVGRMRRVWRWN